MLANDAQRRALRQQMRQRRATLTDREREEAGRAIAGRILASRTYQGARTVMAYAAARGEADVTDVIRDALSSGRTLALPRVEGPGRMTARIVRSEAELATGAWGIPEPGEGCAVIAPEDIDLIIVPGTAFDRLGGRLGQGGGYYDRYLPGTRAFRLGAAYGFQIVGTIEAQAHDVRMDAIVTQEEWIEICSAASAGTPGEETADEH